MTKPSSALLRGLDFEPDDFQRRAFDALDQGSSVLVCAPTGSGKTLVADYAVHRALWQGRRAFYTTPLKALSNQKYGDLVAAHGANNVGLLTGDVSHRADAKVVVMTTEVLRNMIFADSQVLSNLGLVVLDEVHYLQDPYRGSVWEEILIVAPPGITFVCLSATVSNAEQFGAWLATIRGELTVVTETRRPVKLRNFVAIGNKFTRQIELVPLLRQGSPHPTAIALDQRVTRLSRRAGGIRGSPLASPRRAELLEVLSDRDMVPVIVFIFSRSGCEAAARQCLGDGLRFTNPAQRAEIRARCESHVEALSDEELRVLGYGELLAALEMGIGMHHAGMIPAFREAVEECFALGLLSVVFATETLSLGINMPARTVVMERLTKVREHGRSGLTSGEYAQLTGRAGRRGLDVVGNAVVVWAPNVRLTELAVLATQPAPALTSSFRPSYNLAANLVRRYRADQVRYILDRSFAQFLDAEHHEALSRRLDRMLALLEQRLVVDRESWQLTAKGQLLAGIYHESDLLVTEVLNASVFDGLDAPSMAGVCSTLTFEARAGARRRRYAMPGALAERIAAVFDTAEDLRDDEHAAHLPRTAAPDAAFAEGAWLWARGARLEHVLDRCELAPGDFVRNAKQLIDLLRQVALLAPSDATRVGATQAADSLQRGVVASSATITGVPAEQGEQS